jgi:hypothetical protein
MVETLLPWDEMLLVIMAQPHPPQRSMPPESSQNRRPADEGRRFSLIAFRAASTHSRGTPGSGTGTATHSSRGFGVDSARLTYSLSFCPIPSGKVCSRKFSSRSVAPNAVVPNRTSR